MWQAFGSMLRVMVEPKPIERIPWHVGQRVCRKDFEDLLGTVVAQDGEIKVRWDDGRTSYYRRHQANLQLKSADQ